MGGPAHQAALLSGRRFFPERYETILVHGALAPGEESLGHVAEQEGATAVYMPDIVQPVTPSRDLRALLRIAALIRRYRPHLIHTHTAKAGFLGRQAALIARGPRPVLVHTFHGHVLEGYFGPSKSRIYRGLERHLGHRTDVLIGVSQATVADLVRLGVAPAERFRVVPLGLDLGQYAAIDDDTRERERDELGIAADDVVCTFVGRIVPIKRLDLLIESFAAARASDSRLRLLLVGDGEERSVLEEQVARLGLADSVRFLGYREDLAPVLAATDIAVLSSANEGTPVSLIEAGAAGVPSVATDVGGVGEALASDGAILASPGDANSIAEAILLVADDGERRRRMGNAARSYALSRFGVDRLIGDIDGLYADLLKARS